MCKVEWCNGKPNQSGHGYCRRHYDQVRKYGHILDIRGNHDKNRYRILGDITEIEITDGNDRFICATTIDTALLPDVISHRWTENGNGYIRTFNGTRPVYLHRFVAGASESDEVDHINRNKLDNRRCNLRLVSHAENCHNRGAVGSVRRICDRKLKKPFCATITRNGKTNHLGYFETEIEARKAISEFDGA